MGQPLPERSTKARDCYSWYIGEKNQLEANYVSTTRDVFQVRLDGFLTGIHQQGVSLEQSALLAAVVGEIGNNCFDHNLGQWKNTPGCWFQWEGEKGGVQVWIADQGNGVFSTLHRVVPSLKTDQQALEIAFEKTISGRAPEKRGNGLKFVRNIINAHSGRGLVCLSGSGAVSFGAWDKQRHLIKEGLGTPGGKGTGVFTLIFWNELT